MSDEDNFVHDYDSEEEEEGVELDDGLQFSGEEDEGEGGRQQRYITTSYQVLTPDQISEKMFEIIHEVNAVFQVSL